MSRPLADARHLERGSPKTKPRSCGSQPAHESLLNRRLHALSSARRIAIIIQLQCKLETRCPAKVLDREHERGRHTWLSSLRELLEGSRRNLDNLRGTDLFADGLGLLQQARGLLDLAQAGVGEPEVAEGIALAPPVANLASDDKPPLVVPDGLFDLAQAGVGDAEVPEGIALALPVAHLACDDEHPLAVFDRLLGLTHSGIGEAEVAEALTLATAVANLACDDEPLLVISDGLLDLAQPLMRECRDTDQPAEQFGRHT